MVCGICSCDDGFYGKQCECEGNDARAESAAAMSDCRADNETTEICSDHGVCKCGVCECVKRPNPQEVFYGKYCECDNFSCKRKEGLVSEYLPRLHFRKKKMLFLRRGLYTRSRIVIELYILKYEKNDS